jgi:hypothetical protein
VVAEVYLVQLAHMFLSPVLALLLRSELLVIAVLLLPVVLSASLM